MRNFSLWLAAIGVSAAGLAPLSQAKELESPQSFRYDPAGKRDPFVPLIVNNRLASQSAGSFVSELGRPVLHGILWDPAGNSIALIDNFEARIGDQVQGYTIKDIKKDSVILEAEGKSVVLNIAFEEQFPASTTQKEHP